MEEMAKKRVKDSETEQSYLLMHRHINGYGRLFGGQLVAWIDELAGLVGRRHCGHEITTACIDNLNFKHPAFLNDTVVLVGRVTYVGRTSMEVRVDTYVEELATGIRKMINRAYVVMVAIDENGRALPVPGLILESPEQEAEWENAAMNCEKSVTERGSKLTFTRTFAESTGAVFVHSENFILRKSRRVP